MNIVDILLLAVGLFFIVRGAFKGITGEIFSLLGTAGAFFCALKFYAPIGNILQEKLGLSPSIATILTMLCIFFVIFFGCACLEWSIKKVLEKTKLTATDKLLGAGVGFVKLYLISLMVLIAGAIVAPMTGSGWAEESRVLSLTAATWPLVSPMLDKAGLIPDIDAIQNEARDYVIRQAGQNLLGTSADVADRLSRSLTSADLPVLSEDAYITP